MKKCGIFCADLQESRIFFHFGARASALPPTQSGAAQPRPCAAIVRRRGRPLVGTDGPPSRGPMAPALWAGAPPGPGSRGQAPGPLSAGRHRPGRLQRYGARPAHAGRRRSRRRRGRPFMQQGGLPPGGPGVQAAALVRRPPWCSVRGRPPGPLGSVPPGCARPVARGAGTPRRRAQAAAAKRRPRPQTGRPGHRRRCPPPAPAGRGGPVARRPPGPFTPVASAAGRLRPALLRGRGERGKAALENAPPRPPVVVLFRPLQGRLYQAAAGRDRARGAIASKNRLTDRARCGRVTSTRTAMAPRPRSGYYRPGGRGIGVSQADTGGHPVSAFFHSYRRGAATIPGTQAAAWARFVRSGGAHAENPLGAGSAAPSRGFRCPANYRGGERPARAALRFGSHEAGGVPGLERRCAGWVPER